MSRSVNRVILVGNLTRDPEVKTTERGTSLCVFGLATNRSYRSGEELKEETQFHRIVAWQKLGDQAAQLLKKGRKIYVEGHLVYRTYMNAEQQTQGVCEIVCDDFVLLDPKPGSRTSDSAGDTPNSASDEPTIAGQPVEIVDPDELPF